MTPIEIRQSGTHRLGMVLSLPLLFTFLAFTESVTAGGVVLAGAIVGAIVFAPRLARFLDERPVVLTLDDNGLSYASGRGTPRTIPWGEIARTRLRSGGKGGPGLYLELRHPEKFTGAFERMNLALSGFHLRLSLGGLQYPPAEVVRKIEDARLSEEERVST